MSEVSRSASLPELGPLVGEQPDGSPDYTGLVAWAKGQELVYDGDEILAEIAVTSNGQPFKVCHAKRGIGGLRIANALDGGRLAQDELLAPVEGTAGVHIAKPDGSVIRIETADKEMGALELEAGDKVMLRDFGGPDGGCWFVRRPVASATAPAETA